MLFGQQQFDRTKIDFRFIDEIEKIHNGSLQTESPKVFAKQQAQYYSDVIVYTTSVDDAQQVGIKPVSRYKDFYTARISSDQMLQLSQLPSTLYIEAPKLRYPKLDKSLVDMKVDKLHAGLVNSTVYKGKGVIVGIIDSGIDWRHQDFRLDSDTTKSRILFLLDQTTGLEFTQAQINNELDGTPANVVTEADLSGHGTHVASTAAGDGSASNGKYTGVAPEADLIIVKAGDESFSTTNIINAITYIRQKAVALGKPFVINMSLGSHDGSHDGTSSEELSVDAELNGTSGRQIVIAAGNEGSDKIHSGGTLSQGSSSVLKFSISPYSPTAGAANDYVYFTMWYKNGDNFTVNVKTPNNTTVQAGTGTSQTIASANGFVRIINGTGAVNSKGAKECTIEIFDNNSAQPPTADTSWSVTVTAGLVPFGGGYDIWLAGSSMVSEFTSGYSFSKLVGMPGTCEKSITVGAYVTKWSWTNVGNSTFAYSGSDRTNNFSTFSSMGPTRDGRQKPDISAPGQAIGAARSADASFSTAVLLAPSSQYVIEQGTSMASPHVAGLVALMLQAKPSLTSAEIRTKLNATARKDASTGPSVSAQWGNGKIDAQAVLQDVTSVLRNSDRIPSEFSLRQNYPNPFNPTTTIAFSIPTSGKVMLNVYSILGTHIATLVNDNLNAGEYVTTFHAGSLASGVYFYTLTAGTRTETKKMIVTK